jgi:translation initiation factor IF-3
MVTPGGHISTEPRINERIRVPEVRLVGPVGEQVGIVSITDALRLAQEADLDLVEVAPMARPPVCKLMDYGKFKYESALKARESRKNQAQTVIKEIKLRPKIDPHDYGTKKGHVERFLKQGDKVKVTIMFRGREQSRPELGFKLLQRLAGDISELGFVESTPKQDGRNMIMVIGPHKRKTEAMAAARAERASRSPSRGTVRSGPADEGGIPADEGGIEPADDTPQVSAAPAAVPASRATSTPASDEPEAPSADPAAPSADPAAPSADPAAPSADPAAPSADRAAPSADPAAPRPSTPRATPAPSSSRPSAPATRSTTPRPAAPRSAPAPRPTTPPKPAPPRRSGGESAPGPRPVAADASRPAGPSRAASEAER